MMRSYLTLLPSFHLRSEIPPSHFQRRNSVVDQDNLILQDLFKINGNTSQITLTDSHLSYSRLSNFQATPTRHFVAPRRHIYPYSCVAKVTETARAMTILVFPVRAGTGVGKNNEERRRKDITLELLTDDKTEKLKRWSSTIDDLITSTMPPPRRLLVLLNPYGGAGRAEEVFRLACLPLLTHPLITLDVVKTEYHNHALQVVRDMDLATCDGIISVGGDGMLNQVVNGIMSRRDWRKAIALPIGVIPAGTSNGIASNMRLTDAEVASFCILKGLRRRADLLHASQPAAGFHVWGCLNVLWALTGDVSHGAEGNRWLGPTMRGPVEVIMQLVSPTIHSGRLTLFVGGDATGKQTADPLDPVDDGEEDEDTLQPEEGEEDEEIEDVESPYTLLAPTGLTRCRCVRGCGLCHAPDEVTEYPEWLHPLSPSSPDHVWHRSEDLSSHATEEVWDDLSDDEEVVVEEEEEDTTDDGINEGHHRHGHYLARTREYTSSQSLHSIPPMATEHPPATSTSTPVAVSDKESNQADHRATVETGTGTEEDMPYKHTAPVSSSRFSLKRRKDSLPSTSPPSSSSPSTPSSLPPPPPYQKLSTPMNDPPPAAASQPQLLRSRHLYRTMSRIMPARLLERTVSAPDIPSRTSEEPSTPPADSYDSYVGRIASSTNPTPTVEPLTDSEMDEAVMDTTNLASEPGLVKITLDGDVFFFIANSGRYSGTDLQFTPYGHLSDGYLDIAMVRKGGRATLMKMLPHTRSGSLAQQQDYLYYKAKGFVIEPTDQAGCLSVDGERLKNYDPLYCRVYRGALTIYGER
eukprot:TRINITY_DN9840_c0_g1_i9.p1 TRINITY_DN9840_c0_g1~~TRINITY_DN9840_c0_g1_i9.p1  ORF type:complete len:806 (-),score=170.41 TRINITY_DN9840_c0_g1_i9:24-2441(-)